MMRIDVVCCQTASGVYAVPQSEVIFAADARRIVHLRLGIPWLVGVLPGALRVVLVLDLERVLDPALPAPDASLRGAHTRVLHLLGPVPLALVCAGYVPERGCDFRPAGRSLRGLRHLLGLAYPHAGAPLPVIDVAGALTAEHRAALVAAVHASAALQGAAAVDAAT
ncbi:MAG TPA: hypothetical protein VHB98_14835, partial [Chloroflexota bacterium]|nr:hypothetical protein [Chloroflexota bacterium]